MAYNMYNQPSGWMPQQQNPGYSYGGMPMQQAMNNPLMIIRQKFPDIPADMTDPNQIYGYLQQTRGVPPQFAQQLMGMFGGMR